MPAQISCQKNAEEIGETAARFLFHSIQRRLQHQDRFVLGIPGGRSVRGIFSLLPGLDLPWEGIHLFMTDEKLCPLTDPESNFKQAETLFIQKLLDSKKLAAENIHPFRFDPQKEDFGLKAYLKEWEAAGGKFDLLLLGAGEDGHVAGLFPRHDSLEHPGETFFCFRGAPKPPSERMTLSKKLLLRSESAIVIFQGEAKRQAFHQFLDPGAEETFCPAKLVNRLPEVLILTDSPQASMTR